MVRDKVEEAKWKGLCVNVNVKVEERKYERGKDGV